MFKCPKDTRKVYFFCLGSALGYEIATLHSTFFQGPYDENFTQQTRFGQVPC